MMRTILTIALILCVAFSKADSQRRVAKLDEVQINLALNETKSFTQDIEQHQNFAFMVNAQIEPNSTKFGQLEIQLVNKDNERASCRFKYSTNICVLQRCTQHITVKVKCLKQKCSTKLSFSQRHLAHLDRSSSPKSKTLNLPGQIFKLGKQQYKSLVEIQTLKNEEKLLQSDLTVFSNVHAFKLNQIQEISTNNLIFGLKPINQAQDQYVFIEVNQPQKSKDLRFIYLTHEAILKEGIRITDFIQTYGHRSINSYQYSGSFSNHIQTKVRVFAPKQTKNFPFSIRLTGREQQSSPSTDIATLQLPSIVFNGHKFFDIAFLVTKSRHQKYKIVNFQLVIKQVQDVAIFVEIEVTDVAISDIFIYDHVYFSSSQKEEIKFSVSSQVKYEILGQDKDISILTKGSQKYSVSLQTCSLHKGCQFLLKAQNRCQGCSFVFDIEKEDIKNSIIYYEVKDNQIEAKIDLEQQLYFKYQMGPKNYSQIVVNSPNVIIYAQFQSYSRCTLPTAICHQYVINQQNPKIIQNTAANAQNLIISIVGLEKASFKIRFIEEMGGLEVKLGQKFSYLFDNEQKQVTVNFLMNKDTFKDTDQHLYFNVIAPTNSLLLAVKNIEGKQLSSYDGYVQFPKNTIKGNKFEIKISKFGQAFLKQYVHMTLVITTTDSGVKLDATTTHYEKYLPNAQKKFIIDYQPSEQNIINIFTQNLERSHSSMNLTIRDLNLNTADQQNNPFVQKILQRDSQAIDLDFQMQNLDICQEVNCELQITIKSQSKEVLEQSITLLHEQSVISLEDSIWNAYEINALSLGNHFFYIPRHQGKTITILFSSQDKNIYIDYSIYSTKKSINPQNWPWKRHTSHSNDIAFHLNGFQEFKIQQDDPQLKACWPDCVVLITVSQFSSGKSDKRNAQLIKAYKILVSSTIIQAPEEVKFQITMKSSQQNTMFIQVKNFLKSQELTFFTDFRLGRAHIVASLLSKGVQYKLKISDKDFVFNQIQTRLPIELITQALNRHSLKVEQTLLKINFVALSNLKMYFEFTSFIKNHYSLNMDDIQVCVLQEGQEMWYDFIPERDFSIKFYRAKGYPLFKIIKCKEQSYIDCLSKNKKLLKVEVQEKLKTKQQIKTNLQTLQKMQIPIVSADIDTPIGQGIEVFVEKNFEYMGQECQQCIFFIWVYAYNKDLQLSINIRSSFSQIELKEMAMINDRITFQTGSRKYLINAEPEMKTIVSFRIIQGICTVQVFDNQNVLHNQTYNKAKNDYADISIDALRLPSSKPQEQQNQGPLSQLVEIPSAILESARLQNKRHILRHIHVKITSQIQKPIEYLLSYSIGYSGVFLQDGMVTQKNILPSIPYSFYYHNTQKKSHPYLSLSSKVLPGYDDLASKNEFQAKFYYYPDANNREIKEQFRPQMPPKKNNNFVGDSITHVYQLPSIYELYQVQIYSNNYIKLTTSVNHKDIVNLPIGYEYLIKLKAKESIYLMVDRPPSQYLEIAIKKCDTSVPSLFYTNDASEFQKGIYETNQDILNSYQKKLIKTKKSSKTVHFKLTAQENSPSLFSVTVLPATGQKKLTNSRIKAGNNGLLSYTALDSNKIEIQFSPIVCESKQCTIPNANYYLLIAQSVQNIYGQLYCAGYYVVSQLKQKSESTIIEVHDDHFDKKKNVYRYALTLKAQQQFIGVKAVFRSDDRTQEVVYVPTEVTSLWKSLSKVSLGIIFLFSLTLAVVLTIVVAVSTKLARRGYKPIAETQ